MDNLLKSQTSTASPAEPGGLLLVARRKIVLGALILKELDKKEGLRTYVVSLLKNLREGDRELFSDLLQPKEPEDKSSS